MKNLLYGLICLVAVAGTAIGSFFGWNGDQEGSYTVGDRIENFNLKDVNGNMVSLSDIVGQSGAILVFTCNTCPYSKLYEERILQLEDVYGGAGYPVTLINPSDPSLKPGDDIPELVKWIDSNGYGGDYLIDDIGLHHRFGADKTPEVFLLDHEVRLRYRGAIDDSVQGTDSLTAKYLESAIRALETNKDPDPTVTRPIGCVIKSE